MFKKFFAAVLMLSLAGCAMPTHTAKPDANFEGTRTDKNGLLVGSVVENFLTQPHGLYALFFNKKLGNVKLQSPRTTGALCQCLTI